MPRKICWLSQQSAETALKAALMLEDVAFPFSHNLVIDRLDDDSSNVNILLVHRLPDTERAEDEGVTVFVLVS